MADPLIFLHAQKVALQSRFVKGPLSLAAFEFVAFGIKQAWACIFGGLMLALLIGTFLFYPENAVLARYDFITLGAISIQATLLLTRLETWEEAKVILAFHIVGTIMEIFKTYAGSWAYPEDSLLRIADVPLFSGFMYACVGSYIARVWRLFEFRFDRFPPLWAQSILAVAIYVNFFTHHFGPDFRVLLFLSAAIVYGPCVIWFKPNEAHRPMPLLLGLGLVALFIWFAENIGTFTKAWAYPGQEAGWEMVRFAMLGSWFLLMIISFVLVAWLHRSQRSQFELTRDPQRNK
jgi:uncharacterized membrane protein YoaT (DUF817 family)